MKRTLSLPALTLAALVAAASGATLLESAAATDSGAFGEAVVRDVASVRCAGKDL